MTSPERSRGIIGFYVDKLALLWHGHVAGARIEEDGCHCITDNKIIEIYFKCFWIF